MREQRPPREAPGEGRSRREVLGGASGLAVLWLGGCLAGPSSPARGPSPQPGRPVSLLAAGSLNNALENGLRREVDHPLEIEAHGSATVARLVAEGQRDPDIVTVADTALFGSPLHPPWYAEFATNSVVIAYNPDTAAGRQVAEAGTDRWYEPMLEGDVRLGRTDPDTDPLGYRALFTLELASRYYDVPGLRERIPARDQLYPETELVAQFETGGIDAAFVYRNMATERGYGYVELPPEIDLSDPAHVEEWYSTASYTLPEGKTVVGEVVSYASTLRHLASATTAVFDRHVTGDYLHEFGFTVPDDYPRYAGDVPDTIAG